MNRNRLKINLGGAFCVILVLMLSSCMTTDRNYIYGSEKVKNNPLDDLKPKEQNLTEDQLSDIALWKSSEQILFTQKHIEPSESNVQRVFNSWIASYEGFRMASLLGLDATFTMDEMHQFIKALFEDMPTDVETGSLVKSIVVAGWYDDGSPLVINVTRAYTGEKNPTVVYMFNTWDNLRRYGIPLIKEAGIAFEYPRLKMPNGDFKKEFMDSYMMAWFDDGFITASNSVGKDLVAFSSIDDDFKKLNIADNWLRDGNMDNDEEVFTVLSDIIERDELTPIGKVFARMQLFLYHLFHAQAEQAQAVIDELNGSGLLENPEVSETEIGVLAKRDLQRILDIAKMLSN